MTGTVRDAIDDAIETALVAVVGSPDAVEFEPSGEPFTFPGLALFNQGDQLIDQDAVCERRSMDLMLEGYVSGAGTRDGTRARNDLHARAIAALMNDPVLAGLIELIEPGDVRRTTLQFDVGSRLTFSADLTIQFTTARGNPALPA